MAKEIDYVAQEKAIAKEVAGYKPEFVEGLEFVWEDVEVYYAQIYEKNFDEYEGKQRYIAKILIPLEKVESMRALGFNIRDFDNKSGKLPEILIDRQYIEAYKYKVTLKGEEQPPPVCAFDDEEKSDCTENIGNGTIANINVFAKYVKVGATWRLPMYLNGMLIKELVEYKSGGQNRTAKDLF